MILMFIYISGLIFDLYLYLKYLAMFIMIELLLVSNLISKILFLSILALV